MSSKQCNPLNQRVTLRNSSHGDITTGKFFFKSIKSKFFNFTFFYRYLTNEGIEYLRAYLHLPPEIVPSTLKRAARSETARPRPSAMPRGGDASKSTEDRSSYRRAPGGAPDKKGDVGAGSGDVEFVSF